MRRAALALGVALALAACSSGEPIGNPSIVEDPVDGGFSSQRAKPSSPIESETPLRDATIRFNITDQRGVGISDVPLRLRREGTRRVERLFTVMGGVLELRRRPAVYHLTIPAGCAPRREINEGRRDDRIGVIEGRTHRVSIPVKTRRRFMGDSPVDGDIDAPWPVGTRVRVTFLLVDRCKGREAPNTRFDDLRWRTSSNLKVVAPGSMRSSGDARASVVVQCLAAGDAQLFLQDKESPKDRVDLLGLAPPSGFDPDAAWCG